MYSIKELFKIGNGPSSSHTMGPKKATEEILKMYPEANFIKVTLYGSLALTGKGHLTDYIIKKTLGSIRHEIMFDYKMKANHPNTMVFSLYRDQEFLAIETIYSVGGGTICFEGKKTSESVKIYKPTTFTQIVNYCYQKNIKLYDYAYEHEPTIKEYLEVIYHQMLNTINSGLEKEGLLPGELKIPRKAKQLFSKEVLNEGSNLKEKRLLWSYAYATSEENASGGVIVTSPTCGSSGVLPAVLKHFLDKGIDDHDLIINALATAGLIGNFIKEYASISGAFAACQAEVGAACSMAAAFASEILGLSIGQIEIAAEIAMEHHLGLTCDPVKGYVQIPCIERNAVAAIRALDAAHLASLLNEGDSKISFDTVVKTMLQTGQDLSCGYKETSEGGLAKNY